MLYSARKPTGMPEMPPHIKRAKEAKQAIDEKANVIEIDDEANRDQGFVEPDFSFEADPDDDYFEGSEGGNVQHGAQGGTGHDEPIDTDESVAGESTGSSAHPVEAGSRSCWRHLLPSMSSEAVSRRRVRRRCEYLRTRGNLALGGHPTHARSLPTSLRATTVSRRGHQSTKDLHDAFGAKRAFEEDKENAGGQLREDQTNQGHEGHHRPEEQVERLESTANTMGSSIMETILLLREENERKAEARRADEEKCRSEERADTKAETEERRHQDKMEMVERARRDREEARARTQELLLLIGALKKKD
ncbi:hypothetical protein PR003_g10595 [Phytophthora rubi]|uniref:DUF6818 domain-containing protein n=1 Tax=Phytophthora rubi TaxID=129364 RepID=A0A6A3MR57_9STRA|nr:hypothetical protein PR001_g10119 [Phytophthora rubi]KAE9340244.1 hypothetical protein PR003_g10595 [Phytophthora rubi]